MHGSIRALLLAPLLLLGTAAHEAPPIHAAVLGATIHNTRLGVTITLPHGWFVKTDPQEPPCELYFLSGRGHGLRQRLVIRLLGPMSIHGRALGAQRAATIFLRRAFGAHSGVRARRASVTLAGSPAVRLTGVPSNVPNVVFIVAHGGVIYQVATLESDLIQSDQRLALASLRFTARTGRVAYCR